MNEDKLVKCKHVRGDDVELTMSDVQVLSRMVNVALRSSRPSWWWFTFR